MRALCLIVLLGFAVTSAFGQITIETTPYWQNSGGEGKYHTGLQWHDLDMDGYLDLFLSNGNDIDLVRNYAYKNNSGVLPTITTWQSANYEYSGHCATGDINYDGYPELIVSNYLGSAGFTEPNVIDGYLNSGTNLIHSPYWQSDDSIWSFSCALGDLDNDGDLDLAVACGEPYNNHFQKQRVYFNVDGTLETTPGWTSAGSHGMIDVSLGDYDNDGDLDLAFCGDGEFVQVYRNDDGVITQNPAWTSFSVSFSNTIAWGDMDGDGWLDLAVADNDQLGGTGKFKVYKNNSGVLTLNPVWQSATGGYGSSVSWCDVDYDGDFDLAAGRWWSQVFIYENTGTTLATTPSWYSSSSYSSVIEEIQFADVDRDGVSSYVESMDIEPGKGLYYLLRYPLHSVDSVYVDGTKLGYDEFCYSLIDGWVSAGTVPTSSMTVFYQWSYKPDMGVSNWDVSSYVFRNNLDPGFMPGDVNATMSVDIDDIVFLIAYVFGTAAPPDPIESGDPNGSRTIDIDDIVYLVNYVFQGGSAPVYP